MADERITEVDEKTTLGANDLFVIVDEAAAPDQTKRILWPNILKYAVSQALLTTRGDIAFRGAAVAERLAKGTDGQFLKIGASDPVWAWALAAPTGTSWENRTYAGYEILSTETTYTIGSGQDFETLGACADALQGLILVAGIIVQLQEAIELTSTVTFKGMISAGGYLMIDLNGYDITINCNAVGIVFDGQFGGYIRDNAGSPYNSIIAKTGGDCSTSTYLVRYMNYANGNLMNMNLDLNGEDIQAMLLVTNDARCMAFTNMDFIDTAGGGSCVAANVFCRYSGYISSSVTLGIGGDDISIDAGAMVVDSAGHIHTSAGEFTP